MGSAYKNKELATTGQENDRKARSTEIAKRGINTTGELVEFASALITDIMTGRVSYETATAAIRASENILRGVIINYRFGNVPLKDTGKKNAKILTLVPDPCPPK
jgi:hypothetical protein